MKSYNLTSVNQNDTDKIPFKIYFNDITELKDFLNFVKDDHRKVQNWLNGHPRVLVKTTETKDNILHKNKTNQSSSLKNQNSVISTENIVKESTLQQAPVSSVIEYFPSTRSVTFCQSYGGITSICIYMEWLHNDWKPWEFPSLTTELKSLKSSLSGFTLPFAYEHLGGYGTVDNRQQRIDFTFTFRKGLALFLGNVSTWYWYKPERHGGYYNLALLTGAIW